MTTETRSASPFRLMQHARGSGRLRQIGWQCVRIVHDEIRAVSPVYWGQAAKLRAAAALDGAACEYYRHRPAL